MFFVLSGAWEKEKILSPILSLIHSFPYGDSEFFLCPTLVTGRKKICLKLILVGWKDGRS